MHVQRGEHSFEVVEGKHNWFWDVFAKGTWEPGTFRVFDRFVVEGKPMLDIGAWIGPTALYAAKQASEVFAFEPDPIAFFELVQNLALNKTKNVIPYPVAVSDEWKGIPFGPRTGYGDSMSSQLWAKGDDAASVAAVDFASLIMDIKPAFVKIDIEGSEKFIFKGSEIALEMYKPTIHLSLHTPWHIDDLDEFKKAITDGLSMYPYFYGEDMEPIKLADAFNVNAFNSIVATFEKI